MNRPTRVRWRMLGLLFVVGFVAYVLRINMSIAGESMIRDLGLSEIQLGAILSAFAWGYAIFQFPGGIFGDVVGPRRGLTLIMILWGVVTILTGLVPGPATMSVGVTLASLVVLRFLMGVVQAPVFPISSGGSIERWFPAAGWGLPNGLQSTGLTLGAAATGPLVAWMTITLGWRQSFLLTAPIAFLIAGVWWWYSRDNPSEHTGVNRHELDLIQGSRLPVDRTSRERGIWKLVLMNRDILLLTLSYFCMNYVFFLFFNWFFFYLVDVRGFGGQEGGYFTAAQWMVGAIAATLGGFACDRLSKRYGARWGYRLTGATGLFLTAPLLIGGAMAGDPYIAVALLSLSFGCTQLTEGAFWAAAISVAGRHGAAATAVMNTGGSVVGGVGALLVPITAAAFGWVTAVSTGSLFAVLGAVLWFWIRADQPMALDRQTGTEM
jgi:ACS family glucarate transporter-like MFS transporter